MASAPLIDPFLVLHAARVKGFADGPSLAAFCGVDDRSVAFAVDQLSRTGLIRFREGRLAGWSLTPQGRDRHAELIAREREEGGAAFVREGYARFLTVNDDLKDVCTRWQLDGRSPPLLARLEGLHGAVVEIVGVLARGRRRFAVYRHRFDAARDRVVAGDDAAMTRPLTGSYHDVWMELHEDLLVTLGLDRGADDGA
ncbi:MAG TPA: hypothetical protein VGI06_18840 [Acidimicrobiales bacterium]